MGGIPRVACSSHSWMCVSGNAMTFMPAITCAQGGEGVRGFTLAMADLAGVLARARDMGIAVQRDGIRLLGAELTIEAL